MASASDGSSPRAIAAPKGIVGNRGKHDPVESEPEGAERDKTEARRTYDRKTTQQ
jgi:hypothetical protein